MAFSEYMNFKSINHRIVGGTEADINEFPWTVGLYTHYRCKGLPVCGGSLISTQHVLTAAHCIQRNIFLTYIRLPTMYYLGGQSLTILTRFWPFLTTYLPWVDISKGIPF